MQREQVLRQFSLDTKDSALSRLVEEITGANGRLRRDLSRDLERVSSEFSLDNETGALSRLVGRVEQAQRMISAQFSRDDEGSALSQLTRLLEGTNASVNANLTLDDERSPLSRLKRELLHVIDTLVKSNGEFHAELRATLEAFQAKRSEAARSTRHGIEFEAAVGCVLQQEAQRLGDVYEATGTTTGARPYCKT